MGKNLSLVDHAWCNREQLIEKSQDCLRSADNRLKKAWWTDGRTDKPTEGGAN